jgi:hypothetical protein
MSKTFLIGHLPADAGGDRIAAGPPREPRECQASPRWMKGTPRVRIRYVASAVAKTSAADTTPFRPQTTIETRAVERS